MVLRVCFERSISLIPSETEAQVQLRWSNALPLTEETDRVLAAIAFPDDAKLLHTQPDVADRASSNSISPSLCSMRAFRAAEFTQIF